MADDPSRIADGLGVLVVVEIEATAGERPEPAPRSEIVEQVWDTHFDTETNLVEVYINRLRQKISAAGDSKIIQTVHGVGYCLKVAE